MKGAAPMAFQAGNEKVTRHNLSADWLKARWLGDPAFGTDILAPIPGWALRARPGQM